MSAFVLSKSFFLGRSRCRPLLSPGLHPGMSYCPQAEREALFGKLKKLFDSGMYKEFEKLFNKVRKHWLVAETNISYDCATKIMPREANQ